MAGIDESIVYARRVITCALGHYLGNLSALFVHGWVTRLRHSQVVHRNYKGCRRRPVVVATNVFSHLCAQTRLLCLESYGKTYCTTTIEHSTTVYFVNSELLGWMFKYMFSWYNIVVVVPLIGEHMIWRRSLVKKPKPGLTPHRYDIKPEVWRAVKRQLVEFAGSERKLKSRARRVDSDLRLKVFWLIQINGQLEVRDLSRNFPAAFYVDGKEMLRINPWPLNDALPVCYCTGSRFLSHKVKSQTVKVWLFTWYWG